MTTSTILPALLVALAFVVAAVVPAAATTTADIGVFRLIDPPAGQTEIIRDTVDNIDFPFERIRQVIEEKDPDEAILVKWENISALGRFERSDNEIIMSPGLSESSTRYVFTHELGHAVDDIVLPWDNREQVKVLFHASPETYDDHRHDQEHWDSWKAASDDYYFRMSESFADNFVAAFAPSIWNGRTFRYVHATGDLPGFRSVVLAQDRPSDVDPDSPHAENIQRAIELGLMQGKGDGTFEPHGSFTRAQAATVAVRIHNALSADS